MQDNSPREQDPFLLMLREFRPELTEFMTRCARTEPSADERVFITKRLERLTVKGRTLGFDTLMVKIDDLQRALFQSSERLILASLTQGLLDAALYALTFSGDAPASSSLLVDKKWRLVVADDDRIVREMMRKLFSDEAEIYAAANGKEAYALIQQHRPHLVILDDFMPEMTGLRLIEALHATQEFSTIPVMMLTGSDRERDRERAMQAGAVGYVTKPFNPAHLKQSVQEQLKKTNLNTI